MLGRERDGVDDVKRQAAVVRVIMRKLFTGLKRIHSLGLVHRDVGPLIDFVHVLDFNPCN